MTTRARCLPVVLVALATLALASATAAAGAPRWEPVRSSVQGTPSAAARDAARTLLVAVVRGRVLLTTVAAGSASVRPISAAGARVLGSGATPPAVLTAAGGSAAVLWEEAVGGGVQIRASLRGSRNSAFIPPKTISEYPAAGFGRVFSASVGPDGTLLVAWWGGPAGGRLGIYARTWRLGSGWSATVEVSAGTYPVPDQSTGFDVGFVTVGTAIGPLGDMAVTWQEKGPGDSYRLRLATRPAAAGWRQPLSAAEGRVRSLQRPLPVAVDGLGRAVSAWEEGLDLGPDGLATRTCLNAAVTGAGAPERSELRCLPGVVTGAIRTAADADGNLMLAWQAGRLGPPFRAEVQLAARPAGASAWTVPAPLIGEDRGYVDPGGLQPVSDGGGRFLVTVTQGQAVRAADEGLVQVSTVDAAGNPVGAPLGAPARPGRQPRTSDGFLPFSDAPGGVLRWLNRAGLPRRSGVAILRG